jgi:hypothetical protein
MNYFQYTHLCKAGDRGNMNLSHTDCTFYPNVKILTNSNEYLKKLERAIYRMAQEEM